MFMAEVNQLGFVFVLGDIESRLEKSRVLCLSICDDGVVAVFVIFCGCEREKRRQEAECMRRHMRKESRETG